METYTPAEEFHLYKNDYEKWLRYVAPRWRDILVALPPEKKREWWDAASKEQKRALHELKQREAIAA